MPQRTERYVRLYCDSPEWLALGFEGQAIVALLLPFLDTEGAAWLGSAEPWKLAVGLLGAPEEMARRGMERALALRVIEHCEDHLVLPKFRDAQKAAASEALRKRESRRRQRDLAIRVTERDMSQVVTPTNGYHAISTKNEGLSQNVTPRVRPDVRTSGRMSAPNGMGPARSSEPPFEDDPGQMPLPAPAPWIQLLKLWERVSNKGLPCGDPHSHKGRLESLWVACHARDPADPLGVFRGAAEAYCEAQRKRGKTPQLRWFAGDFEQYASTYKQNGKRTSPLIEELEATKAQHAKAIKAGDAGAVARLELDLRRIGKRMTGHA